MTNTVQNSSVLKGNERKFAYQISAMPKDKKRFGFTWDVIRNRLGKLVFVNLMMLITFIPILAMGFIKEYAVSVISSTGNFGSNVGVGYPAAPNLQGAEELLMLYANVFLYLGYFVGSFIAALGVAGGVYCVNKFLRSDEEFRFKDFFIGIKNSYVYAMFASAVFALAFFLSGYAWDYGTYAIAMGANPAGWIVLRVFAILLTVVVGYFALWAVSISASYKVSAKTLCKYTFVLGGRNVLPALVVLLIVAIPAALLFFNILGVFIYAFYALLLIAATTIIWCSFTDWAFEMEAEYITTQVVAQNKEKQAVKTQGKTVSEEEKRRMLLVSGKSAYLSRPVKPLNEGMKPYIPAKITADTLEILLENRKEVAKETKQYLSAHAGEEEYVSYNQMFEEREKVVDVTENNGKQKKFAPKMLNQ